MVTHTHTQLSSRGSVAAISKVSTTMLAVTLALAPLALTSCSSVTEPDATLAVAPPNGHDNDQNDKSKHTIADWTDGGYVHNRSLAILDDSMATFDPNRFTTEQQWRYWAQEIALEFLYDSLYLDPTIAEPSLEYGLSVEATYSGFTHCIDTLILMSAITSREEDYLYRLADIIFTYQLTAEQLSDSLDQLECDISEITWGSNEVICESVAAIAIYSWNFQSTTWGGWDDSSADMMNFDWGEMLAADGTGAVSGAVSGFILGAAKTGTWQGAAIGAGLGAAATGSGASAANALSQTTREN